MSKVKIFVKILLGIAFSAFVLSFLLWLIHFLNAPQGLYIEYNGTVYGNTVLGSSTGGISVPYNSSVTFTIGNSDDWGVYSVQDCIVNIVPNVDNTHDVEFTVGGHYKSSLYSAEADLSTAFCYDYDGKSIPVSSDGTFTITTVKESITELLNAVYPEGVTVDGEYLLSDYPYVAILITSPDESDTLYIPLRYSVGVDTVDIDGGIVF